MLIKSLKSAEVFQGRGCIRSHSCGLFNPLYSGPQSTRDVQYKLIGDEEDNSICFQIKNFLVE